MKSIPNDQYPAWICDECATKAGGSMPEGHVYTIHMGTCCVCGEKKYVTEPRDYRYPQVRVGQYMKANIVRSEDSKNV